MRQLGVVFRAHALDDLKVISEYIAAHDPAAADRVIQRIHRVIFTTLANFPYGGRLDRATGVREFPVPGLPYLIIYLPGADAIDIVAFFHTSRDPSDKPKP